MLVPTVRSNIPEATNEESFLGRVRKTIDDSLPAFLIRSANAISHLETAATLVNVLDGLTGVRHTSRPIPGDLAEDAGLKDKGVGELHDDFEPSILRPGSYVVHDTKHGIGMVIVANSGSLYQRQNLGLHSIVAGHLMKGLTDPELMDPHIYSAVLASKDMVVMPVNTTKGPTWHRYDTLVGPRAAEAILVTPLG